VALQPMAIYKLLPRKNCKECGITTCLAFAMKLAEGKAELALCPYLSEEAKAALGAESGPPVAEVSFGRQDAPIKLGGETVLYRHEKRFVNPTALGVEIATSHNDDEVERRIATVQKTLSRTGQVLAPAFAALVADNADSEGFFTIHKRLSDLSIPLLLDAPANLLATAIPESSTLPLIKAPAENPDFHLELAASNDLPVLFGGATLDALAEASRYARAKGCRQIVLQPQAPALCDRIGMLVASRRLAVLSRNSELGFPLAWWEQAGDLDLAAGLAIMRYASLVLLKDADWARIVPLLVLVQELWSDPQKPISVAPGFYTVGNPSADSPLLVTTNFSLTYFLVTGDAESSGVPCHVLLVDVEGQSVLTAFASGKFTAEKVAATLEEFKAAERVNHQRLVLPGLVSRMSGKLEDASGWQVDVGPQDSGRLPQYLKGYSTVTGAAL
jgi:acetyl-CoA decarbonylase/synthase complex subunit gamma